MSTGRADTLLSVSSTSCGPSPEWSQTAMAALQLPPADDSGAHCRGLDELTVQPPRDAAPAAPPVLDAPPAELLDAQGSPQSSVLQSASPASGVPSAGQTRSRLGVWRT
ncbi:hypothetical protein [Streptomyces pseudovenezuelae]|uniref:hypothetical protein n=1 Tax=Streptomyces pseudovenezuelae TaxID=67350 RepID=UPI0036E39D64